MLISCVEATIGMTFASDSMKDFGYGSNVRLDLLFDLIDRRTSRLRQPPPQPLGLLRKEDGLRTTEVTCHFVPLGPDAVKVWVDVVKVKNATVWRSSYEIECMGDAIGSAIAWPKDKVALC